MSTDKNTFLIVTCKKDMWQFEMLIRSAYKFCKPCNIMIIYNESKEDYQDWLDWFGLLQKLFLKKFNVQTFSIEDFMPLSIKHGGWIRQQMLKVLAYKEISTENYIILDSKNFFIDNCSINDIKRCDLKPNWWSEDLDGWIKACCEYFGYNPEGTQLGPTITPFIFEKKIIESMMKKWINVNDFVEWFTKVGRQDGISASEFFMYEIFEQNNTPFMLQSGINSNVSTIWHHDLDSKELKNQAQAILEKKQKFNINISGIHFTVLQKYKKHDVQQLLIDLGCEIILPSTIDYPF